MSARVRIHRSLVAPSLVLAGALLASEAHAVVYQVGPGKEYEELEPLMRDVLQPGDVVEVEGDHVYQGDLLLWGGSWEGAASGTEDAPITIRGVRKNGKRPTIRAQSEYGIVLYMNWSVFEGFEVEGGSMAAIVHKGHHVVIRDVLVRDCVGQGILGTDTESGSLTVEYTEVRDCGDGEYFHSIYVAGDQVLYPGHVFRLQHSFVHAGRGGNAVKSRAERNEIYANWIEGAGYHELDLIGPADPSFEGLAREDSDVVGNVLVKAPGNTFGCVRAGGDGNLSTEGRYRLVNNTCVLAPESRAPFFLQYGLESVELRNNVFVGGIPLTELAIMVDGADAPIGGSNNFFSSNIQLATNAGTPVELTGSVVGDAPGFVDAAGFDFRPIEGSVLVDAGVDPVPSWEAHPFPSPLERPTHLPPARTIEAVGQAAVRAPVGALDIGAMEYGTGAPPGTGGGGSGGSGSGGDGGGGGVGADDDGCGCRVVEPSGGRGALAAGLLGATLLLARRRRRR